MEKILITSSTDRSTLTKPERVSDSLWKMMKEDYPDSVLQTFLNNPDRYLDAWDYYFRENYLNAFEKELL